MNNITSNGIRRAHSFDSYDNLDRWKAMREHRMQFLSTRAKFDKAPPSKPPPPTPPPRHSSKFKVKSSVPPPLFTSSPVNSLKQQIKNEDTLSRGNESFSSLSWKKNEENSLYLPMNKDILTAINVDDSSIAHQYKINKSHNDDQNKFQILKSPGNVLKLTQSWQKYKEDCEEISILKPTPQSVLEPEITQENKQPIDEVNEPVVERKIVETLQYQEPTFFKDVNIPSVSQCPNKFILSDYQDPSVPHLNSFGVKKVKKAFIPSSELQSSFFKNNADSNQSDFSSKRPNQLHLSNPSDLPMPKNKATVQMPLHEKNWKPKNNTQKNSRTYLESSFKIFTESLLDQGDSSSIYSNDLRVGRPRRVSTGSMHEPTVWRSQSTTGPVKTLVQKFSKFESTNNC